MVCLVKESFQGERTSLSVVVGWWGAPYTKANLAFFQL